MARRLIVSYVCTADDNNALARRWWRARDVVWPWPANPEQVETEFRRVIEKLNERASEPTSRDATAMESFRRGYALDRK